LRGRKGGREGGREGGRDWETKGSPRTREIGVSTKRCCWSSLSPIRLSTEAEGEETEGAVAGAVAMDLRWQGERERDEAAAGKARR